MTKASQLGIASIVALLVLSGSAAAEEVQGEFGNECVTSLALGRTYPTDCSVNAVYKGKTLCFGSEKSRELFLKNPDELLLKAHIFYSSKQQ
ncbi:MAG: hypothetical protein FJX44_08470 [Alphaproteobacteria bacterium]|nr:hypothetical protein [Alphaproteobacteria bacterium]